MDQFPITELSSSSIDHYFHMCRPVPKRLSIRGTFPTSPELKLLAVVGARNHTLYGKLACEQLVAGLSGYPVVIVSGLAHGIDSVAHTTALNNGITCIAFPGSGLSKSALYPRRNYFLAERILTAGGCLVSEYPTDQRAAPWVFPMRNRLIAGCAHATLIIECTHDSGTRITARLATEYNRDVLAVPGNINQQLSEGPNELIKLGAVPITSPHDILYALGITPNSKPLATPKNKHAHDYAHEYTAKPTPPVLTSSTPTQSVLTQLAIPDKNPNIAPGNLFELFPVTEKHLVILNTITSPIHIDQLSKIIPTEDINTLNVQLTELELMNKIRIILGVIYKQ